jgi:hypothetical protein
MMESIMSRESEVVMSNAEKPVQHPPSHPQEVKVFFRPRFGIRAESSGLSVDVSALPEKEKDEPKRG